MFEDQILYACRLRIYVVRSSGGGLSFEYSLNDDMNSPEHRASYLCAFILSKLRGGQIPMNQETGYQTLTSYVQNQGTYGSAKVITPT